MNTTRKAVVLYVLAFSLLLSGCGPGQFLGPTLTPTPTVTPSPIPTTTPTPIPTPTITPTPLHDPNGVLTIPLTNPIALANEDLSVTIVQATTTWEGVDDVLVLGIVAELNRDQDLAFGRCSLAVLLPVADLELMRSFTWGYSCLIIDAGEDLLQPVAMAVASVENGNLSWPPNATNTGELEDATKTLMSVNSGEPKGYYLFFSRPNNLAEIKIRLEVKGW